MRLPAQLSDPPMSAFGTDITPFTSDVGAPFRKQTSAATIGMSPNIKSCTLIISEPNELTAKIHDPMPVLLQPEDFDLWLNGTVGIELLKRATNDYLQVRPVSQRVNSSRWPGDDPTLIDQ